MAKDFRVPPDYMGKDQAAQRLGMSEKTLDRRRKTEPLLRAGAIRVAGRVCFLAKAVEAYFRFGTERGYV